MFELKDKLSSIYVYSDVLNPNNCTSIKYYNSYFYQIDTNSASLKIYEIIDNEFSLKYNFSLSDYPDSRSVLAYNNYLFINTSENTVRVFTISNGELIIIGNDNGYSENGIGPYLITDGTYLYSYNYGTSILNIFSFDEFTGVTLIFEDFILLDTVFDTNTVKNYFAYIDLNDDNEYSLLTVSRFNGTTLDTVVDSYDIGFDGFCYMSGNFLCIDNFFGLLKVYSISEDIGITLVCEFDYSILDGYNEEYYVESFDVSNEYFSIGFLNAIVILTMSGTVYDTISLTKNARFVQITDDNKIFINEGSSVFVDGLIDHQIDYSYYGLIIIPPIASFTVSSSSGKRPLTVLFTNTTTDATSYLWDFGDGNTSLEENPSNIFELAGEYTVILTATNDKGSDTAIETITVNSIYTRSNPTNVTFTEINTNGVEYSSTEPSTDRVMTRVKPKSVTWS